MAERKQKIKEEWKDIEGYDGDYQVSNLGRVRSFKRGYCNVLKGTVSNRGYKMVHLRSAIKGPKFLSVHRLVGKHFIPNPENKPEINHKDGNKLNNKIVNLEWVTRTENFRHAFKTGLYKGRELHIDTVESVDKSQFKNMVHSNKTVEEVCRYLNISKDFYYWYLETLNIDAGKNHCNKWEYVDQEKFRKMIREGEIYKEIQEEFNITKSTVYEWKKKYCDFFFIRKKKKHTCWEDVNQERFEEMIKDNKYYKKVMQEFDISLGTYYNWKNKYCREV